MTPFWVAVGAGVAGIDFRRFIGYLFVDAAIWFVLGVLIFTLIPAWDSAWRIRRCRPCHSRAG